MQWNQLLAEKRLGGSIIIEEYTEKKYPRREYEKDYKRILNCASFRRLQDKTQVFPLDKSDFVRTRLTHSCETSAIAKTLGKMIVSNLRHKNQDKQAIIDIPEILACAGLIHDIGNPPFGHFGEEIIQKWFITNLNKFKIADGINDEMPISIVLAELQEDFHHFDGNAQALRILTKLHFHDSDWGLNLTAPVLGTLIKYPSFSGQVRSESDREYNICCKKMGLFCAEQETYKNITQITGTDETCRHPLAYVLEAADDIAYKTADIEDGFKKGLYNLDQLTKFADEILDDFEYDEKKTGYSTKLFEKLKEMRNKLSTTYEKEIVDKDFAAMQNWIPYVQEWLMYCAAYRFNGSYSYIMSGRYKFDLFHDTHHEYSMKIIEKIMVKFIYSNRDILKLELAANTILTSLFDRFIPAVLYHDEIYKCKEHVEIEAYKKLYKILSDNYIESYKMELREYKKKESDLDKIRRWDIYLRLLLVVDYISGMTDSYAKSLYQELTGIYKL